jgi:hypothetical protein
MNKRTSHRDPRTGTSAIGAVFAACALSVGIAAALEPSLEVKSSGAVDYTGHQREVLDDFRVADANRDGVLEASEYERFRERRAAKRYLATQHQRETMETDVTKKRRKNTPPAADETPGGFPMTEHQESAVRDFDKADASGDRRLSFIEVYHYETFERPGQFPPKSNSVPQVVAGHWESVSLEDHPKVITTPPFSVKALERALSSGGFDMVDANNDGRVSIFEANDKSMLYWTADIYSFEKADLNGNWHLDEQEFNRFQELISATVADARRAGDFPPRQ